MKTLTLILMMLSLPPCPSRPTAGTGSEGGLISRYTDNFVDLQSIILPLGGALTAPRREERGQVPGTNDTIKFHDGLEFTIIGRFHSENSYRRFPPKYENTLRKEVWDLGQHSAGISIRFRSNSPFIDVKWVVKNDAVMDHMPFTGIKGIDLYSIVEGRWKYISTGRVKGKSNEFMMVNNAGEGYREYLLNLPLYDGTDTVLIGISSSASITKPQENYLISKKPVVYYGSSIAQGGCASRPGMLFTNILARKLDRPFINMGFSGNGTFDLSVGDA
ncbi:MAG: SGNH/GDSL hydrolase family protein, partial [Bacteroidia bacterium]|nr:SGNH/GDSL hydrolase family protein [Bacteroidia bacterium]